MSNYTQTRSESEQYKEAYRHNSRVNLPKLMNAKRAKCPDCGLRWHPSVMTFDHVDRGTKFKDITTLIWWEPETFDAEMAKGEWVCQNCHIVRELKRDAPLKDKFKQYYLGQTSIRGAILRNNIKEIEYEVRF